MERKRPHSKTPPRQAASDDHATAGTSASTSVEPTTAAPASTSSTGSTAQQPHSSAAAGRIGPVLPDYSTQLVDNDLLRAITQQRRPIEFSPDPCRPRTTLEERRHDFETELSQDMFHFVFIDKPAAGYNLLLRIDPAQTVLQNDGEIIIRASKPSNVDGVRGHWSGRINRHSLQGEMIYVPGQSNEAPPPPRGTPPSTTVVAPSKRRMTTSPSADRALPSDFPVSETSAGGSRRTSESSESTLTPAPETAE